MCFLEKKLLWPCGWNWDVIPDYAAVSPSCTQTQRNIYVEICEIRHRVAARVRKRELCVHVCSRAVSQDQHHPGTMLLPHQRFRGFQRCIFFAIFFWTSRRIQSILEHSCSDWGVRTCFRGETVLPVNISEWPRLDHVKWEPLDPKLENIQSILQRWDQG